ncbi:phosphatase [Erythrobacter sp. SG61-1L]|uniref:PhoX family protein n=1 Tax=Erythrobacter sp. SG61-1L TaxID=1603897 RepID=UPI0006C91422|nr:PhoX family phosphatase [Erythrobacter sp. SG61-1L]KPL68863.1 phosphatase [Erythrobacter sp. SG61-1L]
MTDLIPGNGYSDGDVDTNNTGGETLWDIAEARHSRRSVMRGGLAASSAAFLGGAMLSGCTDDVLGGGSDGGKTVAVNQEIAVSTGQSVELTASSAGQWAQVEGPEVELITEEDGRISFIAPAVSNVTTLVFSLLNGIARVLVSPAKLSFRAVDKNRDDIVTVPQGYSVTVMTRLGDPIAANVADYKNDGTDTDFDKRIGDHGDALHFFGMSQTGKRNENSSKRGLMVQNHENLNVQYLHPNGPTNVGSGPRPEAEAVKEIDAHGVSITEYKSERRAGWNWVKDSAFNRRITPNTPMQFNGPVKGSDFLKTTFSTDGTQGRGTINNCANGHTEWGTALTCEENWAGYFKRSGDDALRSARELTSLRRYGVTGGSGNYAWSSVTPANPSDTRFRRWDARASEGLTATQDYRNEPNQMGWVVEIDPYDPTSKPRKRTALGRMGHEGAWLGKLEAGRKVAVYMGDDARREYFYKFVSTATWEARDAMADNRLAIGDKYLDSGTLYVAKFNADGTGSWLPLVYGQVPNRAAVGNDPEYVFQNQQDILVNARLAADALGATPMDRPEWTACNPRTGEIYLTLTNNSSSGRPLNGTDAANPRHYVSQPGNSYGNANGHIIRIREGGDNQAATSFIWDIYLFGADSAEAGSDVNISGLDASNDFSSPDGLWFSRTQNPAGHLRPLLWIQTDDGAFTDQTNNQMLAALPGFVGDGGSRTITNVGTGGATAMQTTQAGTNATPGTLKRFLTGPLECEITGVDTTPDGRTLFVGIQHPGENGSADAPSSHWPQSQSGTNSGRPRSAVVAITRNDGGIVGL